ncbi:hypothetical protein HBDW_45850 [Herbaspirillum sp. DW155]|uniref:hypothetical protein n=1 Tax=Herbaspirillum sp. DW155 TaxID=3095609 RepID=UPI003086DFF8|nr:hypothetical protein HBDW_45850 [Herbaspirillum sp. DW155]
MQTSISIRYKGPAVDNGLMDVYQAASNMVAFSEFMVTAVKSKYGDHTDVKAEVSGFEHGSFVTNLVMDIAGPAATLLATVSAKDVYSLVKDAMSLWKFLKGAAPKAVSYTNEKGMQANVTNNNGQVIQVQTEALNLVLSDKGAETVGRFVRDALHKSGIDSVNIDGASDALAEVQKDEADYFVPIVREEKLSDNVVTMSLILLSPNFQEGNKWKFSDGDSNNFSATMADEDFVRRVNEGERFGKGDMLQVEMHIQQYKVGQKINTERRVLKVIQHHEQHTQPGLFEG